MAPQCSAATVVQMVSGGVKSRASCDNRVTLLPLSYHVQWGRDRKMTVTETVTALGIMGNMENLALP